MTIRWLHWMEDWILGLSVESETKDKMWGREFDMILKTKGAK